MTAETEQVQHTPGPWEMSPQGWIIAQDREVVATVPIDFMSAPTDYADARLIAAAPLMFNYLSDLRDEVEREDGGSHAVCAMVARRFWREWEATGKDA